MSRWYYTPDNRQRLGPVTSKQLRQLALSGAILPDHMLMREGEGKWVPAAKVKGLFPVSAQQTAIPAPADAPTPVKARRKGPLIGLAGCLAGLLILCLGIGVAGVTISRWLTNHDTSNNAALDSAAKTHKSAPVAERDEPKREDGQSGKPVDEVHDMAPEKVQDIFAAFNRDLASAEPKYTDKTLVLSDIVCKVQKDAKGRYLIEAFPNARAVKTQSRGPRVMSHEDFTRNAYSAALNAKYKPGVLLYIPKENLSSFAGLEGKPVVVRGLCKGTMADEATIPSFVIVVENCVCLRGYTERKPLFTRLSGVVSDT